MATKAVTASNVELLNAVRAFASSDYKSRIPNVTTANIAKTARMIHEYQPLWNEFYTTLFDRIGLSLFHTNQFENRLKPFKKSMNFGAVVQESSANLIEAEAYNEEKNVNPWEAAKPQMVTDYHVKNRADTYGMRVNEQLLYEAMTSEGELAAYLNGLYRLPQQSAEQDEYTIMRDLFSVANAAGDLVNVQAPDVAGSADATKADAARQLTEMLRTYYLKLKGFYSRSYNAAGVDATARELVLLTTPEVMATNDVYSLASAFNMDKAQWMADRVIVVDEFAGMTGTQAILCDIDAFQCYDLLYKSASIYNPRNDSLYTYLHARGIYSLSRQRPIVRFSTEATTVPSLTSKTVQSVAVTADPANVVETGDAVTYQLTPKVTYSDSTTDANAYGIIAAATPTSSAVSTESAFLPDTGTYLDRNNVLHVAPAENGEPKYSSIVVNFYATKDASKSGTVTIQTAGA